MTRKLVVLLAVGLVLAPAASAKGPHAVLSSGPEAIEPGKPWLATVELNEFRRAPRPLLVASRGDRRVTAQVRRVPASMIGTAGFKVRLTFPTAGRWRLALVAGKRHFAFPPVGVGSDQAPQDWVAFLKGSATARHGAGGAWTQGPEVDAGGRGTPLAPEVVTLAEPARDSGGPWLWIPAVGLALAGGAGVLTRRRARRAP